MICTCTLNPSLDYYMEFDSPLSVNEKNRSKLEYYEAGGKGINVSIVLNNLQIPTRACGFLGGFTREFYIKLLQKYEFVQPNFTYVEGHTRINLKLLDGNKVTELNAAGPYITYEDMENLKEKVERLTTGDYFVLAGSCQEYLKEDVLDMVINCIQNDVRVVLDLKEELVLPLLEHHPFLVKASLEEFNVEHYDEETMIAKAREIYQMGARHVLMMCKKSKAVLVCEEGEFICDLASQEQTVSYVGTSDALTAGFLMNYLRSNDAVDSFRFGASCGIATAFSKGLATREKIDAVYEDTIITPIR